MGEKWSVSKQRETRKQNRTWLRFSRIPTNICSQPVMLGDAILFPLTISCKFNVAIIYRWVQSHTTHYKRNRLHMHFIHIELMLTTSVDSTQTMFLSYFSRFKMQRGLNYSLSLM